MKILNSTFSAAEVVKGASIPAATLQNWVKRGVVVGHGDDDIGGGGGPGLRRRFSFFAIMQIAVAAELVRIAPGMDLKQAFLAAREFTHMSDGPEGSYAGAPANIRERDPGMPWHYTWGETFLVMSGDQCKVVLVEEVKSLVSLLSDLRIREGAVLVDAGKVFFDVLARLDRNPWAVLDEAYSVA